MPTERRDRRPGKSVTRVRGQGSECGGWRYSRIWSVKGITGICYSAAYMSQTRESWPGSALTTLEVAPDWQEPMIPRRMSRPFIPVPMLTSRLTSWSESWNIETKQCTLLPTIWRWWSCFSQNTHPHKKCHFWPAAMATVSHQYCGQHTIVRENVWNTAKNVKSHVFLDLEKNVKKRRSNNI